MATLKLKEEECGNGSLPHLCMRCGVPTDDTVQRTFTWMSPYWLLLYLTGFGVVVVLIIYFLFAKRMMVDVPVCPRHRYQWEKNVLLVFFLFIVSIGVFLGLMNVLGRMSIELPEGLFLICLILIEIIFLILAIMCALVSLMKIQPTRIDADSIILAGVDEEFKQATEPIQADEEYRETGNPRLVMQESALQPIILDDIPRIDET